MKDEYLIKYGEIALKKGNRRKFEKLLKRNIKDKFSGIPTVLTIKNGRFFLDVENLSEQEVASRLSKVFGLVGFYKTYSCRKDLEDIIPLARELAKRNIDENRGGRFKIETRRIDKSLPLNNYGYSAELGGAILEAFPQLTVDVHNPDWTIFLELRDKAYLYGFGYSCKRGLPVGSAGRGILLLSGGIDSPVAGYLMSRRGLKLEAVYFHTPPYTSEDSLEKVKSLAGILSDWNNGLILHVVNFTQIQLMINKKVPENATTLHSRAAMMRIASKICTLREMGGLVTGESLSQVASQTLESLAYTGQSASFPVFRPCIGMDKEEIIDISKELDAFDISIQPFDDCCTLFAPEHPLVNPGLEDMRESWDSIEGIDFLINQAAEEAEYLIL